MEQSTIPVLERSSSNPTTDEWELKGEGSQSEKQQQDLEHGSSNTVAGQDKENLGRNDPIGGLRPQENVRRSLEQRHIQVSLSF